MKVQLARNVERWTLRCCLQQKYQEWRNLCHGCLLHFVSPITLPCAIRAMEVDVNEEITWKRYNHSLLSNNVLLIHYPKRYKETKNCDDEKVEIFGTTCCGWNKLASIKLFFSPIYVSKTIVVITESKYYYLKIEIEG